MTADDLVTAITQAPTPADAQRIVRDAPPRVLAEVADLLHIDDYGHSAPWTRAAIVREARS